MSQFDVFENPITRARRAYPFLVVLQADIANASHERIVAPLVARARLSTALGRLTPIVKIDGEQYVVLVPNLVAVRVADLRAVRGRLTAHRTELVAALDYLFLGV